MGGLSQLALQFATNAATKPAHLPRPIARTGARKSRCTLRARTKRDGELEPCRYPDYGTREVQSHPLAADHPSFLPTGFYTGALVTCRSAVYCAQIVM